MKRFLKIIILSFVVSIAHADNISIKAPKIAENGAVVPVMVIADNPIKPGDTLIIKNGSKVALKLTTDSNP